jgi:4-carboxymuconolactone decarboxylase
VVSERLPRLTPDELDEPQRALHRAIMGGPRSSGPQAFSLTTDDGSLVGPFGLMLHAPRVGQPLQELGAAVRYLTSFTGREREIAILTVATQLDSAFEWWAHTRIGRSAGLSDAELDAIASGEFTDRSGADPVEAAVHRASRLLAARDDLDDETYAALVAVLGEQRLMELVVLTGYYATLALMLDVFRVGAPPPVA